MIFDSVLKKWYRRPRDERFIFLEAFLLLAFARLGVLFLPFKWFAFFLGAKSGHSAHNLSSYQFDVARKIGRMTRTAARYTPWESVCLPQAVAAKIMLRRRRIPGTLYLGLAKGKYGESAMEAHAWLRCGEAVLTGAPGHQRYTVVAMFS
ncbi:MAG: lasso peptide biosynthesis B2 protein [Candidatus Riflebacteria bacterium]|nr:lasso peptide biosynthesis B2 protein [Candidatus Riflebacteria bacterium]